MTERKSVCRLCSKTLLTPLKQLFDFARVKAVPPGASATIEFEVSASAVAEVDEQSGDLVSAAASFTLLFDDGGGQVVSLPAKVSGARTVLDKLPHRTRKWVAVVVVVVHRLRQN